MTGGGTADASAAAAVPVRLADLTTLGLGGPAAGGLIAIRDAQQLPAALTAGPVLVVGGGSNLVVADAGVAGTVLKIEIPGLAITADSATIGAGVDWDEAVATLVDAGFTGIAPLSGIPGRAGATPVQNVGAYGTEIADLLVSVTVCDRADGRIRRIEAADLALGYRTSSLRGTDTAVVTDLTLRLPRTPQPVRYGELARTLGVPVHGTAPETEVRAAVLALRRSKGMVIDAADPDTRSVGSFFTNPILAPAGFAVADLAIRRVLGHGDYPRYPAGTAGAQKLSAAWLIEHAGFRKGHRGPGGRVALSSKHTLALVNRGGTTVDLLELAAQIRDRVLELFAVRLLPEPVLVGTALPEPVRRPG